MESNIKISGVNVKIFKPSTCPYCGTGIDAVIVSNYVDEVDNICNLYLTMKCPVCKDIFFAKYFIGMHLKDAEYYDYRYQYTKIIGGKALKQSFSSEIQEISNDFVNIYNESYQAEQEGLNEIAGIGYRKAFEFLVKDYAIYLNPDNADKIANQNLTNCISDIFSEHEKGIFERATWLGNDQTHYYNKHSDFKIDDLKKIIMICISKIETNYREIKYVESIKKEGKK